MVAVRFMRVVDLVGAGLRRGTGSLCWGRYQRPKGLDYSVLQERYAWQSSPLRQDLLMNHDAFPNRQPELI